MSRTNYLGALPYFIGDPNYLGAPRRHYGHGGGYQPSNAMSAAMQRANHAASFARPDIPGTPARDAALLPAAFPVFAFALASGVNVINQIMNPQTPFRGQRLTSTVIRNGTSALVSAPVIQQFLVGQKPIIVTSNGVPLEVFSQGSFDTNLLLPPTVPGVVYSLNVNLTAALTTTDTIIALVAVIGSGVL